MTDRAAGRVTVPDVVRLLFYIGRDVASDAGVTLANPDSDGPPIGSLAWPGLLCIISQLPSAGTDAHRWDSVAVEITEHGTVEFKAIRDNNEPSVTDAEHGTPERERYIDLTERDAHT